MQAIADSLCDSVVIKSGKMDALLQSKYSQLLIDLLQFNVKLDCNDKLYEELKWHSDGFVASIAQTVAEYKKHHGLYPFRVFVSGPPMSGKTTVAKAICDAYKLHHISAKSVIDEALASAVSN